MLQRCFWYHVIHSNFMQFLPAVSGWNALVSIQILFAFSRATAVQKMCWFSSTATVAGLTGSRNLLDPRCRRLRAGIHKDFPSQIVPRQLQNASFTAMNFKQLRKGLSSTKTPFFQPLLSLYDAEQVELSWMDLRLPTLLWQVSPSMTWLSSATKLRSSCLSQGPFLCGKYDKLSGWAKIKPDWWSHKDSFREREREYV